MNEWINKDLNFETKVFKELSKNFERKNDFNKNESWSEKRIENSIFRQNGLFGWLMDQCDQIWRNLTTLAIF